MWNVGMNVRMMWGSIWWDPGVGHELRDPGLSWQWAVGVLCEAAPMLAETGQGK